MLNQARQIASLKIKEAAQVSFSASGFNCELASYQSPASAFLVVAKRALLLYFCGGGKTPISIGADLKLREQGKVRRTLVVALSGGRYHWYPEYQKFSGLDVRLIDGSKKERVAKWHDAQWGDVTVSHYECIRSDINIVKDLMFDLVIFDEAHTFRSADTGLIKAITELRDKPDYCWGLTATPIQKRLEDLYWIMSVINTEVLGDFTEFQAAHIVRELMSVRVAGRRRTFWKVVGYRDVEAVQKKMAPFYIRKTQDDVPEFERKRIRVYRPLRLCDKQALKYREILSQVDPKSQKQTLLEKFQKLEFSTCSTAFFDPAIKGVERSKLNFHLFRGHHSSKVDDILTLLQTELLDEKVVFFSKYKVLLYHAMSSFNDAGIGWTEISGDVVDAQQRELNRQSFIDDPKVQVCLVTQAAEMSINLHSARYIVFGSEIYNPARQEQIIGRIDRPFLQKSKVITSVHYSSVGTFEPLLHERMESEAKLMSDVFGVGEIIETMTPEELFRFMNAKNVISDD